MTCTQFEVASGNDTKVNETVSIKYVSAASEYFK